jgi:hypothetical protein
MSDGAPLVHGEVQASNDILSEINTLMALQQSQRDYVDGITFNTAFYTADVPPGFIPLDTSDPHGLLQNMADAGSGEFLDVGNGATIDLTRFVVPVRISRFALKEIWIANANTVWWGNQLLLDTDGDGIPDDVERQWASDHGLDPNLCWQKYDCDGDGVGDGVQYRLSSNLCQNADCSPAGAPTPCLGMHPTGTPGNIHFNDTDGDFLNDCEEKMLGTNYKNPDTNGDYLPDWMAFVNQVQMIGTSDLYTDPDSDGSTNYQELKQDTPVSVPNSQVPGLIKLSYTGRMVSSDAVQDCYSYKLNYIPFHSTNDKIRIFLIENRRSLNEKIIVRAAEKQINAYGIVDMQDSDFKKISLN